MLICRVVFLSFQDYAFLSMFEINLVHRHPTTRQRKMKNSRDDVLTRRQLT